MPITPSIQVSQSALNPALITVADNSSGSDPTIAARRIFFETPQGTFLVTSGTTTDYIVWPYADVSSSFNVLTQDYALSITVLWVNSGGTTLYTYQQVYCFPQFNKNFFYYLWQQQALSYEIMADQPYFKNLAIYWTNIIGAMNAITFGADVAASQAGLDRATYMMNNQDQFFQN